VANLAVIGVRIVPAIAAALWLVGQAHAADIVVNAPDASGRVVIDINGDLNRGDEQTFQPLIKGMRDYEHIYVSPVSRGGLAIPALLIGQIIHDTGMNTTISPGGFCTSSCAIIWASGRRRYCHSTAHVGFHGVYDVNTRERSHDANVVAAAYLTHWGYSPAAVSWMLESPPTAMHWLTRELEQKYGIVVVQPPPDEPHRRLSANLYDYAIGRNRPPRQDKPPQQSPASTGSPSPAYIRLDGYYKYVDIASVWYLRFYSDGTVVMDQRPDTSSLPITTETLNKTHFKGTGIFQTDDHLIKFQLRTSGTLPSLEFNGQAWINEVNFPGQSYKFKPWQH
jgi:hypothetical protein